MTIAQHLIENAIMDMEQGKDYEYFSTQNYNKEMAETAGIKLYHIWEMAQQVVYTIKPFWLLDDVDKL